VKHSSGVSSISIVKEGEIVMIKLQTFIQKLLRTQKANLYRYKGIYAVQGVQNKFVIQGVHESVQFDYLSKWKPEEKKRCSMVFIGKDLKEEELKKDFLACFSVDTKKRPLEGATEPIAKRVRTEVETQI